MTIPIAFTSTQWQPHLIVACREELPMTDTQPASDITTEQIATYAYLIWEHEGRPHGRDRIHWREAEEQLRNLTHRNPVTVIGTNPSNQTKHAKRPPVRARKNTP
ncbi:MAG: hypothetical protein PCFJNLEI_03380 [Verrucomicrobiae bacterium]|nr:hypothetical protein [Verrucomicrobiae bacterium]